MKKSMTLSIAIAAAMSSTTMQASADSSPFSATSMEHGYQVAMHHGDKDKSKAKDGKCGEGMCGGAKDKKDGHDMNHDHNHDHGNHKGHDKAHDGSCGGSMKGNDGKCGAKDSKKAKDGKCGEGKCGGMG